ncbi:hypothetical protein K493DRAFT_313975, partial [Basidiobolus meristosporus CBS 931.73]
MSDIQKIIRFRRQNKTNHSSHSQPTASPILHASSSVKQIAEETDGLESFISASSLKLYSQEERSDFVRLAEMLDQSYQQFLKT